MCLIHFIYGALCFVCDTIYNDYIILLWSAIDAPAGVLVYGMSSTTDSEDRSLSEIGAFLSPFDHDDADVTLRSSDKLEFHVHKLILSTSSPFFKSMFSLPQTDATVSLNQKPIIDLQENGQTIAVLLTQIYPVVSATTEPETLDEIVDALAAAQKYDMAAVSQRLNEKFTQSKFMQDDPIAAFCAAYSRELAIPARAAAKASLKRRMNLDSIEDQLEYTNGPAFHKLYKFHRACSAAAVQAVSGTHLTWITPSQTWWDLTNVSQLCVCGRYNYTIPVGSGSATWQASSPYHDFIMRTINVLADHPCCEAVANYSFLTPSYKKAGCIHCRVTLLGLPEFSHLLGEEVERLVSMVRFYIIP